jgi:uncharacterized protein YbaA (DUF1428 family)
MSYVDGFVLPLPKDKVEDYRRMSEKAGKVWIEHGALEYRECVGEDIAAKKGVMPFADTVIAKHKETVVFAWIVFKSRAHRDAVNAKVMKDPRITADMKEPCPFDPKRMAYGGFDVLVDLKGRAAPKKAAVKKTAAKKKTAKKAAR